METLKTSHIKNAVLKIPYQIIFRWLHVLKWSDTKSFLLFFYFLCCCAFTEMCHSAGHHVVRATSSRSIRPDVYFIRLIYLLLTSASCNITPKTPEWLFDILINSDDIAVRLFKETFHFHVVKMQFKSCFLKQEAFISATLWHATVPLGKKEENLQLIFQLFNLRSWAHRVSRALFCFPPLPSFNFHKSFASSIIRCISFRSLQFGARCWPAANKAVRMWWRAAEWECRTSLGENSATLSFFFFLMFFFPTLYMMFSSGDRWLLRHFSHFTHWVCLLCMEALVLLKQTRKLSTHTLLIPGLETVKKHLKEWNIALRNKHKIRLLTHNDRKKMTSKLTGPINEQRENIDVKGSYLIHVFSLQLKHCICTSAQVEKKEPLVVRSHRLW